MVDVAVLGAGPAGVATACALARLGYSVALLGQPRGEALEGFSQRTLVQLRNDGLHAAAAAVRVACPRGSRWGGVQSTSGTEFIVERASFDRGLHEDARRLGIAVQATHVESAQRQGDVWHVRTRNGDLRSRAVVEARGRRVRGASCVGPQLLAISQHYRSPQARPAGASVFSLHDCWCWLVQDGEESWLQVVGAPRNRGAASDLSGQIESVRSAVPEISLALQGAEPVGALRARAATARMVLPADEPGRVRVGDAAFAMDPLTGHGIYEALASAGVGVAAIHTWLGGGDWSIVQRYVNERCQDLWQKKMAAAAGFYEQASGAQTHSFWRQHAAAYATLAADWSRHDPGPVRVEMRPVLNEQRIELQRVVVMPDRPRGVWQMDSVDLAVLVDWLRTGPDAGGPRVPPKLNRPRASVARAIRWLATHGLITAGPGRADHTTFFSTSLGG